jgi:hypothetical protein
MDILYEGKLRVFDFDDTLAKTNSFIYVTGKDGKERKLTPGEYAMYEKKPSDKFDYRDFNAVKEPQEISSMKKLFQRINQATGKRKVAILTARAMFKPIKTYLKDAGFGNVFVVALGDANPQKKVDWIKGQIKKGFDDIAFWDDSPKNIDAVRKIKDEYPDIKLQTQLVQY